MAKFIMSIFFGIVTASFAIGFFVSFVKNLLKLCKLLRKENLNFWELSYRIIMDCLLPVFIMFAAAGASIFFFSLAAAP